MEENIKIAFVGNFYGLGKVYDQWGTGFCILLSQLKCIDKIDVICPYSDENLEVKFPDKINIKETFELSKSLSIFNIIKEMKKGNYDLVIFNYGPTVFGRSSIMNLFGLFMPIYSSRLKNTVIISQGSSITNDATNLGYNSLNDKMKYKVLNMLEKHLYTKVKSFAQLPIYEKILKEKVKKNKVLGVLKSDYIDAVLTVYLNGKINEEFMESAINNDKPKILLHGFWGPQKDIEFALKTMESIENENYKFELIISGGINVHFPEYKSYFYNVLNKYNNIALNYLGYVPEKELMQLFLNADLVLMPYNVPGGQSGVLEMSSFFGNNVICFDFPEFREEVKEDDNIIFVNKNNFYSEIKKYLDNYKPLKRNIEIKKKIGSAEYNVHEFIEKALAVEKV